MLQFLCPTPFVPILLSVQLLEVLERVFPLALSAEQHSQQLLFYMQMTLRIEPLILLMVETH